jgi:hypothetical protein
VATQIRPMMATSKPSKENQVRDVDSGLGQCTLRRHGQRLERRETTASYSVRAFGLVLAADRARDRRASRNRECIPESGQYCRAATGCLGTAWPAKPAKEVTGSNATELPELNPNPENLSNQGKSNPEDSKPANAVATGSNATELLELNPNPNPENLSDKGKSNPEDSKPANEVATGSAVESSVGSEIPSLPRLSVSRSVRP